MMEPTPNVNNTQKMSNPVPDSPTKMSQNQIDLTFKDLSYKVSVKNPDRKGSRGPKCKSEECNQMLMLS